MRDPEYRDWIPVFTGMTREETRDPFPPVILNRKRSASDWGSSWIWIPVFTGMTEKIMETTERNTGTTKQAR